MSLVAEAVGAALVGCGWTVSLLAWPREPSDDPVGRQLARAAPDVALLICEVDTATRLAGAAALMRQWDGPWVVLSGTGPEITWGGFRDAGATVVRSTLIGLDELQELIRSVAAGTVSRTDELDEYVDAWRATRAGRDEIRRRIESLSPRERQVLELLRRGMVVRKIASRDGLSEATVRSQVRSVLRKLGVRSQIAAVSALRSAEEIDG
ncbi:MAG: bvgA [Nocardioides sp.]|jgi:DNA-binding NarL/FixJ family response regulator|nr:bvgA [Nocardioides sp.]